MLIEELPAIVSVTVLCMVFCAVWWRDTRGARTYRARIDKFTAWNKESFALRPADSRNTPSSVE